MDSIRIFEIAREKNISSKDIVKVCLDLGFKVKGHMSTVNPEQKKEILRIIDKGKKDTAGKRKSDWNEEKLLNIKKVLDKELDKEEKEGRFKVKLLQGKKKIAAKKSSKVAETASREYKIIKTKEKTKKKPEIKKIIELPEGITAKQLSERINISSSEIIQVLFDMGEIVNVNQTLDKDLVEFLSHEYNFKYNIIGFEDKIEEIFKDSKEDLVRKPPVVTVMGHVDHGKTTLLDAIRQSDVAQNEAGGITQHIGAYQIKYNDKKITFIDTPGHEAFTAMRARGARVTDIAVVVIAADDGIMPQTIEAINHAKEANVPIIVAINKIDLPNSNPDKIKRGLTEFNLVPEEWGGETIFAELSAKNKINIDELLEMILLIADLNEIMGNEKAEGSGIIIESRLDKGMGAVGTVIIRRGSIKVGDFFITGNSYGKVRSIRDEKMQIIKKGVLSQPIEISGFTSVPQAGDKFFIVKNERVAKEIISKRDYDRKISKLAGARRHISLEELSEISKENDIKKLKIVLKSESYGSLDAVVKSLMELEKEEIKINIIHRAVGAISESDVLLAAASNAIVVGFRIISTPKSRKLAEEENIDVRTYNIIYKLIDDIKLSLEGLLEPKIEELEKGRIEVRRVFKIPKEGVIAGCYVLEGGVDRGDKVRVIRDEKIIYESKIVSLHRFKDDVKKVNAGYECGIKVENYQDINKGDFLEIYELKEIEGSKSSSK
ncbi:MAG: translation initiation factor IF-2 [Actinobacteria bacterium]|nr:translation initiation factor IF-2 [Actinomycetota bacterium]